MKFILIDKILSYEAGKELKAVKGVSLAEEYLGDHFPAFPVLPGVMLLEGLVESASWLVRCSSDFAHSMVLLESARNVKYKSFASPGGQIEYTVEAKKIESGESSFKASGICGEEPIIDARIKLRHFNLGDSDESKRRLDENIIGNLRHRWKLLTQ